MAISVERQPISMQIINKPKLEAIRVYHAREGRLEMSMTRILEALIDAEYERLKLCSEENTPAS